ncbi:hypothetical protein DSCO28_47780 [Desulfosarcina ovata subsp. sediminis]|uniref:Uncharacterized protein n=1 Tax=Desulfosarcina ovata subsp. sediminis TaxID=885957 RepID=A0A5K7ZVE4_9BACT|nr:hypothetical protein [Desulfosarcina ovata]BBO84212.1 hypothetical protein DSCO28_47780 [Desulfosarcina ovata subsp. sediminis]
MYIRTIKRKNKDGSVVEYVQLAHNVRHPEKRYPKAEVIYSFGRRDQLDLAALRRLVKSVSRFFDPEEKTDPHATPAPGSAITFVRSRPAGGAYLLRALWNRLEITGCLCEAAKPRVLSPSVSIALFALVARRTLDPFSPLPIRQWASQDVFLGEEIAFQQRHLDRVRELLTTHTGNIQAAVRQSATRLWDLNLDREAGDCTDARGATGDSDPDTPLLADWLSLLLRQVAEVNTGMPWPGIRCAMQRLQLGEFLDAGERVCRFTELTRIQRNILDKLEIDFPQQPPAVNLPA